MSSDKPIPVTEEQFVIWSQTVIGPMLAMLDEGACSDAANLVWSKYLPNLRQMRRLVPEFDARLVRWDAAAWGERGPHELAAWLRAWQRAWTAPVWQVGDGPPRRVIQVTEVAAEDGQLVLRTEVDEIRISLEMLREALR